jgi:hypothetical protein
VRFALGETPLWQLFFDGAFSMPARLTLFYDDASLLPGVAEEDLVVYRYVEPFEGCTEYVDCGWIQLESAEHDLAADEIVVDVDGFSPFLIGARRPAPDCSEARAVPDVLWPPDHRFRAVHLEGVTHPEGDPLAVEVLSIRQDEPVDGFGDGATAPDGFGVGYPAAAVRAERQAHGDGRVYHLRFRTSDPHASACEAEVTVCVPADRRRPGPFPPFGGRGRGRGKPDLGDATCTDGGALHDSTELPGWLWLLLGGHDCGLGPGLALALPLLWVGRRRAPRAGLSTLWNRRRNRPRPARRRPPART